MIGHHLGQLFLRVGLAATFLVAGLSKVLPKDDYSGDAAAALANMGVITPQKPAATPGGEPATNPIAFRLQQPESPATQPETPAAPPGRRARPPEDVRSLTPTQPEAQPEATEPESLPGDEQPEQATTPGSPATASAGEYTAADFPTPVKLPRLYRIALMLKASAHPQPDAEGKTPMVLVPIWAADTKVPGIGMATPVVLAWVAAITEVVGGAMLLVGFMTRLWALGLVGVMLTAIWLTTIGPAIQAGNAFLGFLPSHHHIFAITEQGFPYMHEFWQFALACMAFAVMFAGPGAISVDGILFGGGGSDEEGDE